MEPREIFHDKRELFSMEDLLPECLSDTGKKRKKMFRGTVKEVLCDS